MFNGLSLTKLFRQFVQFGLVGIINTIVSFLIYELLAVYLKVNYVVSNFFSYAVGAAISFLLNKVWTFNDNGPIASEALVFLMVFIPCFLLQNALLVLLKEKFRLSKTVSYIFATAFYLVINFLGHRFITFRNA